MSEHCKNCKALADENRKIKEWAEVTIEEYGRKIDVLSKEVKRLKTFGVLLHASVARVFKGE
jgi:hypothetical protein